MDPNEWKVSDVGEIAIRLEKAQGEESLWSTSNVTSVPFVSCEGDSSKSTVRCFGCGKEGHIKRRVVLRCQEAPRIVSPSAGLLLMHNRVLLTRKLTGLVNGSAMFATRLDISLLTVPLARNGAEISQPRHKIDTHSYESCWALHPHSKPNYLKEELQLRVHAACLQKLVLEAHVSNFGLLPLQGNGSFECGKDKSQVVQDNR